MRKGIKAIEVFIFSAVSIVFLHSVYNLIMSSQVAKPPIGSIAPARLPSSKPRTTAGEAASFAESAPYRTQCLARGESFETDARKLRITGPLCSSGKSKIRSPSSAGSVEAKVENLTSRFQATVFIDSAEATFSTDFIPLEPGLNKITMEFRSSGESSAAPIELLVTRK